MINCAKKKSDNFKGNFRVVELQSKYTKKYINTTSIFCFNSSFHKICVFKLHLKHVKLFCFSFDRIDTGIIYSALVLFLKQILKLYVRNQQDM